MISKRFISRESRSFMRCYSLQMAVTKRAMMDPTKESRMEQNVQYAEEKATNEF